MSSKENSAVGRSSVQLYLELRSASVINILGAIRREERKLQKQAVKLQRQLNGLKAAAKVSRQLCEPGSRQSTKQSHVSGGESEDFRSREKTMGKSEGGSKESREL